VFAWLIIGLVLLCFVFVIWPVRPAGPRPCPICDGKGVTHLMAAGGRAQVCGVCRGTGLHPGRIL
jgi:hypothetical protein